MDSQQFQPPPPYQPPPPQFQPPPQGQQFTPMTVGQILDRTFNLYKKNFVRFIAIVAVVYVPIALIMIVAMSAVVSSFGPFQVTPAKDGTIPNIEPEQVLQLVVPALIAIFLFLLAQVLCSAALTKSVSASYLGGEVTVGQAYKAVLPKLLWLVIAGILVFLAALGGFLLCVVPCVIFLLWFALTTQAIVVENLGPIAGMGRSKRLVSGNLGKVFGVGIVVWIINWIISLVFQQVGGLVAGVPEPGDLVTPVIITQLFSLAGQMLVMPISAGAMILLYYDLRIRKEGFDLYMLSQAFGREGTPPDGTPPLQQV